MWFKNLLTYRLTQDIPFEPEALEAALASKPARPCASQELTTYGFVAPFGKGEDAPLVHVSGDFLLIAARKGVTGLKVSTRKPDIYSDCAGVGVEISSS